VSIHLPFGTKTNGTVQATMTGLHWKEKMHLFGVHQFEQQMVTTTPQTSPSSTTHTGHEQFQYHFSDHFSKESTI